MLVSCLLQCLVVLLVCVLPTVSPSSPRNWLLVGVTNQTLTSDSSSNAEVHPGTTYGTRRLSCLKTEAENETDALSLTLFTEAEALIYFFQWKFLFNV